MVCPTTSRFNCLFRGSATPCGERMVSFPMELSSPHSMVLRLVRPTVSRSTCLGIGHAVRRKDGFVSNRPLVAAQHGPTGGVPDRFPFNLFGDRPCHAAKGWFRFQWNSRRRTAWPYGWCARPFPVQPVWGPAMPCGERMVSFPMDLSSPHSMVLRLVRPTVSRSTCLGTGHAMRRKEGFVSNRPLIATQHGPTGGVPDRIAAAGHGLMGSARPDIQSECA